MLTLHVEAPTYALLVRKAVDALGMALSPGGKILLDPALVGVQPTDTGKVVTATEPVAATGEKSVKRQTKPSAKSDTLPASADASGAVEAQGVSEQNNGTSAPAVPVSPAAEDVEANGSDEGTPAAPTFDQVKDKLRQVSDSKGGKGIDDVMKILAGLGLKDADAKIKNIKPDQYQKAFDDASAILVAIAA